MPEMDPITMYRADDTVEVSSPADKFARIAEGWSETPPEDQYPILLWRGPYEALEEITVHSASEKEQKTGEGFSMDRPEDPKQPGAPRVGETRDQSPRGVDDGAAPGEGADPVNGAHTPDNQDVSPDPGSRQGVTPAPPRPGTRKPR